MQTINEILFPTDFSESAQNAFRFCLLAAQKLKARIRVLHVVIPDYEATDLAVITAHAITGKVEAARTVLKEFVDLGLTQVQAAAPLAFVPEIVSEVEVGQPVSTIINIANQNDVPMIIMGTMGERDTFNRIFGSITGSILDKTDRLLWIVPEEARFDQMDVLAYATDLEASDPYHLWKMAKLFAPFQSKMHCIHVTSKTDANRAITLEEIEAILPKAVTGLEVNFHTLAPNGKAVDDLLEQFVEDQKVDTLILFAKRHNLWERLFQKSHTKHLSLHAKVPLLIHK